MVIAFIPATTSASALDEKSVAVTVSVDLD